MRFILPLVLLTLCVSPVLADDAFIGSDISPISGSAISTMTFEHNDQDINGSGFKGWATIYVVNDTNTAWSDFHFNLFEVVAPRGVIFRDATTTGQNPVYKLNGAAVPVGGFTWSINNNAPGGPTLDMIFSNNYFVQQGDMATFKLYTDNTAAPNTKFGLAMYPTSDYVPEPSSLLAFATALVGFTGLTLRRKN